MNGWTRSTATPPDKLKVTFFVNRSSDQELFDWLYGLPYRKQSLAVREMLLAGIRSSGLSTGAQSAGQSTPGVVSSSSSSPHIIGQDQARAGAFADQSPPTVSVTHAGQPAASTAPRREVSPADLATINKLNEIC